MCVYGNSIFFMFTWTKRRQERVTNSLSYEMAQVKDSFRRFDVDNSGKLDSKEFRYMWLGTKSSGKKNSWEWYVYIYVLFNIGDVYVMYYMHKYTVYIHVYIIDIRIHITYNYSHIIIYIWDSIYILCIKCILYT